MILQAVSEILTLVRKLKSDAQVSMKTEIGSLSISAPSALLKSAQMAESDLKTAARAQNVTWKTSETLHVEGDLVLEA
jgi:valyl-tRNA synthetase